MCSYTGQLHSANVCSCWHVNFCIKQYFTWGVIIHLAHEKKKVYIFIFIFIFIYI